MSKINSIFISYRRIDSAGHTGRLFDYLSANLRNVQIFMDVVGIDPGVKWKNKIKESIEACSILLVIIGKSWLHVNDEYGRRRLDITDDPVGFEIELAINNPKIRVIPVLVDGANIPPTNGLPERITDLLSSNSIRIHDETFHDDAERLTRNLRAYLEPKPEPPQFFSESSGIRMENLDFRHGWQVKMLGDVANIQRGQTSNETNEAGDYPLYNASGIVDFISEYQQKEASLLISQLFTLGEKPAVIKTIENFSAVQSIFVITPNSDQILLDYLGIILSYYDYRFLISQSSTLGGIPRVDGRLLSQIAIPLPSLQIQLNFINSITKIADEIQGIRENLQTQLDLTYELEISLIKQLLQGNEYNG